jgi:MATE family multidrug resistance protein
MPSDPNHSEPTNPVSAVPADALALPQPPIAWRSGILRVMTLSAPIIPAMLAQMIIGFADSWMVSQLGVAELHWFGLTIPMDTVSQAGVGKTALAAITPASLTCWTVMSVFIGTTAVVSTFAAQSLGRGEPREAGRYAWQAIYFSLAMLAVSAATSTISPWLFGHFAPSQAVRDSQVAYFNVRMWSLAPVVLVSGLASFFNGIHQPVRPGVVAVISNVLNVGFNWLLVYGHCGCPRLGVPGSAWASLIASVLGAMVMLAFFFEPRFVRGFGTLAGWRPSWHRLANLVRIGTPSAAGWLMDMIGWTVLSVALIEPMGEAPGAASNAALQYLQIGFMPVVGVGIAVSALVGKAIGQRRIGDARRFAACGFLIGAFYQGLIGLGMILLRVPLMQFFSTDPAVVELGSRLLIFAGLFQVFDAMGIVYTHALRGAGDTLYILLAYAALNFLFFVPVSIGATALVGRLWPAHQVLAPWIVGTAYVMLLGWVCWRRWRAKRWETIDLFANQVS